MPAKNGWTPIALAPLSGILDTRSRPAELAPAAIRYKLNMAINRTGSLSTRAGHAALNFGSASNSPALPNWDFHRRGTTRESVTFLFEATASSGIRYLYAGSETALHKLNNSTSEWATLSGSGYVGPVWKAAVLSDDVVFVNNQTIRLHDINGFGLGTGFTWTPNAAVTRAKIAITFADVVMLMNVDVSGTGTRTSRVVWSDYRDAKNFDGSNPASLSGFQDLDYGDAILNAAEMMGSLYIFCERSIWRCTINVTQNTIFAFQKIYSEPKNSSGCLAYANTLVTTGRELYWWSRDAIWTFNPYLVTPECTEWLLKGTGALFSEDNSDRFNRACCDSIVGEYKPLTREIWYSYPQGGEVAICSNNRCMVLNTEYKTMDLVDHGYTAFCNFRKTPGAGEACNADQTFIGASATDYCLKSIGDVFYREMATVVNGSKVNDIPDASYALTEVGYYCRWVGCIPLGLTNVEKSCRELLVDCEVKPNSLTSPNLLTLSIGNSFALQDPMSIDPRCAVQFHVQDPQPLACPDTETIAAMSADNLRPSDPLAFVMMEQANYLFYDLRVVGPDGVSAPTFHDAAFSALRFDVKTV